jgi:hypothetical protein
VGKKLRRQIHTKPHIYLQLFLKFLQRVPGAAVDSKKAPIKKLSIIKMFL